MNVKLVSITKSVIEGTELSAEELLVYIARVSNPSNQLNTGTSDKLIGYMIKNKHWSPFDMVNMTVEVTTSKAIAIQILRHWSIKPQEFSQRYAEVTDIEPIQLRKAATSNRQSSNEIMIFGPEDTIKVSDAYYGAGGHIPAQEAVDALIRNCKEVYDGLISLGVAKECARMVLPMATSTTMYLNGSVRSWIHYMQQRCDTHAQLEHQEVAHLIEEIFKQNFPNTHKALMNAKEN